MLLWRVDTSASGLALFRGLRDAWGDSVGMAYGSPSRQNAVYCLNRAVRGVEVKPNGKCRPVLAEGKNRAVTLRGVVDEQGGFGPAGPDLLGSRPRRWPGGGAGGVLPG